MWFQDSIFYQIYPLGFCGAPHQNDGVPQNRIAKVAEWIPHKQRLGVNALYLCPVFESDTHGYDTRDYRLIDSRLGSNAQFAELCGQLHDTGIRVVLDGVFHHVGRGFWAFQDVVRNREASPYRDWFYIDFSRDSNYHDGLWYEGWEGHFEMVKLNLDCPGVVDHLLDCIRGWVEEFGIDGIRLDVAYLLGEGFMRRLRTFTDNLKPDFFLLGEAIHGDYNRLVAPDRLHSCTNYECYKGIFSSFNDENLYEIAYSLNRQFGPDDWSIYKDLPLFTFVDNHDGSRIASSLHDAANLPLAYGLLYGMPGIPCLYYGSEWGVAGEKIEGTDDNLRPCFDRPQFTALSEWIATLGRIRAHNPALRYGGYRQLYLTNRQLVFERTHGENRVLVAINMEQAPHTAHFPVDADLEDLATGQRFHVGDAWELPAKSVLFCKQG